ncbi:unnamed protein product [Merluccius merluccius]
MELQTQINVYISFMKPFLSRNNTAGGCKGELISVSDLQMLNSDFIPLEALPYLTVRQLSEVSSTPGQLTTPAQVAMVMAHVPNPQLAAFFDDFSPTIMGQEDMFPSPVRSAMLQVVFDRANLSDPGVSNAEVLLWLHNRLRPLLVELSPIHVAPFFSVVAERNCSTEQDAVRILNSTQSTLSDTTQKDIHDHIIQLLREPTPLRCYEPNQSFYGFLNGWFLDFQYPNLTTFLSLMPESRQLELVNSLPTSHLGDLLSRPDTVDDEANLCLIYNLYTNTPVFLETETLPDMVRPQTLRCVWPTALSSTERSEVNAWFDRRLPNYLDFLTKDLLTSTATQNASCLAFQKLVSTLALHNFAAADFNRQDVYDVIKSYLTSGMEKVPKCYDPTDPELNSTAWFAEYIGAFMPFLTLDDLNMFGSAEVFTVNPLNIALLNLVLPVNLTTFYTELIYLQDSNFNPLLLPVVFQCFAPGLSFVQLTADESITVLHNLTSHCTDLNPEISSALAANFGENINADAIAALGNDSISSISVGQLNSIKPQDLLANLDILSSTSDWNQGQASAIIQALVSSGMLQLNSTSLVMLGSLLVGVPSSAFSSITGTQLITASQNTAFLAHLTNAPMIVQQTFVTQIISVNNDITAVVENVPDDLATEIPPIFLVFSSVSTVVTNRVNRKKWKPAQAALFFEKVAERMEGHENNISSSVLQGFTCTKVVTLSRIPNLVKACRRRGRRRVILKETQLTCMYNQIKDEADLTSFNLYPPDVLLYYNYAQVPNNLCKSYFMELADADFSVFSDTLNFKRAELFTNAKSCLGIGDRLSRDNVMVLGNMCCTLEGSYIQNSDPYILENLKNCQDFTGEQVTAMETLLLSGTTIYGAPAVWSVQTLVDLEILPLYLTSNFYVQFDTRTKRRFLRFFLRTLRRNGVSRQKRRTMKRAIRKSIRGRGRVKRAADDQCTEGIITQVIIRDATFPFDYSDVAQFNSCLSATTVRDNLASITQAVDDREYLQIVLNKLREAYSASSSIPEEQVKSLGPASRTATIADISMWDITKIDTLSALMASADGEWDSDLAAAIISKYLSVPGNSLGSAELNSIGGANLCALDVSVLSNISKSSLRNANAPTVTNCTIEKKRVLFDIAEAAFSSQTRAEIIPLTIYQIILPYLGGANRDYVERLAASNVSMDLATFTSLDPDVVLNLTVNQVKDLLAANLADLKAYENNTVVNMWGTGGDGTRPDTLCLLIFLLFVITYQHILSA